MSSGMLQQATVHRVTPAASKHTNRPTANHAVLPVSHNADPTCRTILPGAEALQADDRGDASLLCILPRSRPRNPDVSAVCTGSESRINGRSDRMLMARAQAMSSTAMILAM